MDKWDKRFLNLAGHIGGWSKDPSTKCGAVITDSQNRILSTGFNGLPSGVTDSHDRLNHRPTKYRMVVHAELNAILFSRCDLTGATIYVNPMPPCAQCAAAIVQSGIARVVSFHPTPDQLSRWGEDFSIMVKMFREAGVDLHLCEEAV